ncbi:putative ribonuclease H-like domain-containing protein [Tanacetum coccineum]
MNQFCKIKGIKREFSVARTLQQNRVAERKNRTLIEAARTMLVDSKLPTTFWAEVVNTACYVQNRVLVIKPHNKTPYELFLGRKPALSFMRPFGCPVTIHNTLDHLGKFNGKADEGFFVRYSTISKPFRVFNSRTRIVEENLHVKESNQVNASTKENIDASQVGKKIVLDQEYILLPLLTSVPSLSKSSKDSSDAGFKPLGVEEKIYLEHPENKDSKVPKIEEPRVHQKQDSNVNNTNNINTVYLTVNAADIENNVVDENIVYGCIDDPNMHNLKQIVYSDVDEEVGAEADMNNLAITVSVSLIPTTRVHKDHPLEQIIGDIHSAPQTRRITKNVTEHVEPKKVMSTQRLDANVNNTNNINTVGLTANAADIENNVVDENIVYGCIDDPNMPNLEEIVYFDDDEKVGAEADMNNLATTVPVSPIPTTRVHKDHPLEQIIKDIHSAPQTRRMTKNVTEHEKALYGLHQAPRAWYETLSTYLLENGFRKGTIDKTLFIKKDKDDILLVQAYVDDIIFGSTKKSLCTKFEQMMHKSFQMSSMGEITFFLGLQVKQKDDGIFISQDKYVADILKKFDFATVKTASTPMETNKALLKDEEAADVDVHLYRSMIGSLMYLIASRPDIMFAVCACARFQVTPKTSHLYAVKRIFRYLKCHPKLGLWYLIDSPFDLEAFSDSDYVDASLDRKSTTGGCQFLRRRFISWQCKKQTIVANSTTEVEYVAAANYCGHVLWIQNQLLDYGYNFMNTKIYIDNESTI